MPPRTGRPRLGHRRPHGRAPRRRLRPYRQGDLDGLCGVYALVNAVRWLAPSLSEPQAKALFGRLVEAVRGFDRAPRAVAHAGLSRAQLLKLVAVARAHLARRHGLALTVERVPRRLRRRWSVRVLWRLLEQRLAQGEVAVVGLCGRHDHWTLVVAAGPRQLALFDSGRMRALRRSQVATSWPSWNDQASIIDAADVLLIGVAESDDGSA